MFDKSAIQTLSEAASISQASHAVKHALADASVVALPDSFATHDLEKYQLTRRRARGAMTTEDTKAFASYVEAHAELGTAVFVDQAGMKAVAVLNLGTAHEPGHADNTATLALKSVAAYDAMRKIASGTPQTQATIAEWMEDWQHLLKCYANPDDTGGDYSAMSTAKAIAAVRNITIEAARKVESEEGQLSASKSAFESVKASSKHQLPSYIYVTLQPYVGLAERTFVLRLGILTGGDKTAVVLRIVKAEEHQQEMAAEFAALVSGALEHTSHPVLIGSYSAKS